jgi:hypothetical protein
MAGTGEGKGGEEIARNRAQFFFEICVGWSGRPGHACMSEPLRRDCCVQHSPSHLGALGNKICAEMVTPRSE